jgi:hypothetical protein
MVMVTPLTFYLSALNPTFDVPTSAVKWIIKAGQNSNFILWLALISYNLLLPINNE